jgi:hypothetical protein
MFAAIDHDGTGEVDVEAIFAHYDASRNAMVRLLDMNSPKSAASGKVPPVPPPCPSRGRPDVHLLEGPKGPVAQVHAAEEGGQGAA